MTNLDSLTAKEAKLLWVTERITRETYHAAVLRDMKPYKKEYGNSDNPHDIKGICDPHRENGDTDRKLLLCYFSISQYSKRLGWKTMTKEWSEDRNKFIEWAIKNGHKETSRIWRKNRNKPHSPSNSYFKFDLGKVKRDE